MSLVRSDDREEPYESYEVLQVRTAGSDRGGRTSTPPTRPDPYGVMTALIVVAMVLWAMVAAGVVP